MNAIFDKFAALTIVQRLLIYTGIVVVIGALFVYFIIVPKFTEKATLEEEQQALLTRLEEVKQSAKDLTTILKQNEEAEKDYEMAARLLPDKEEIPSLLEYVSRCGKEAGLESTLFEPKKEEDKNFYSEIPIYMELSGTYHNLGMFFDKVSKLSRIVNIDNYNIAHTAQNDKEDVENPSLLRITCTAVTYKFLGKPNENKTKK